MTKTYYTKSHYAEIDVEDGYFYVINKVTGDCEEYPSWETAAAARKALAQRYHELAKSAGWTDETGKIKEIYLSKTEDFNG